MREWEAARDVLRAVRWTGVVCFIDAVERVGWGCTRRGDPAQAVEATRSAASATAAGMRGMDVPSYVLPQRFGLRPVTSRTEGRLSTSDQS